MKHIIIALIAVSGVFCASCATTERIAEGIAVKNLSGNGTFAKSSVGLNTETKIPEISTIFVSGDYSSSKSGTNSVTYREETSCSVWNAKSVTKKRFLSITLTDDGKVEKAIRAVADVLHEAAPASDDVKKDGETEK